MQDKSIVNTKDGCQTPPTASQDIIPTPPVDILTPKAAAVLAAYRASRRGQKRLLENAQKTPRKHYRHSDPDFDPKNVPPKEGSEKPKTVLEKLLERGRAAKSKKTKSEDGNRSKGHSRDDKLVAQIMEYWNSKSVLRKVSFPSDGKERTYLHTKNMVMWAVMGTLGVPHRLCPKPKKYKYKDFVYAIDCLEQDAITKVDDCGLSAFCRKLTLHEFIFNVFYKPGMDMNDMWTLRTLSPFLYYMLGR